MTNILHRLPRMQRPSDTDFYNLYVYYRKETIWILPNLTETAPSASARRVNVILPQRLCGTRQRTTEAEPFMTTTASARTAVRTRRMLPVLSATTTLTEMLQSTEQAQMICLRLRQMSCRQYPLLCQLSRMNLRQIMTRLTRKQKLPTISAMLRRAELPRNPQRSRPPIPKMAPSEAMMLSRSASKNRARTIISTLWEKNIRAEIVL